MGLARDSKVIVGEVILCGPATKGLINDSWTYGDEEPPSIPQPLHRPPIANPSLQQPLPAQPRGPC
ncbi:hypothetical protein E2C01_091860 [Portunus trituberculatus]|uniref:Uncharacterized protein n=1 Tax=Portunus trituberculatus TaxID=210409 RepID=A0A5B7JW79_PORTR|nr:hypothetical protein [Portunus trituberculatus]